MIQVYLTQNGSYEIRTTQHQGKQYIIVPVIMMVEGVHHGSHGPLLHTKEELSKFPEAWNGRPVVINHPMDEEGNGVCANSPELAEVAKVGVLYNTFFDDAVCGLRAEAWLDVNKLQEVSPVAYDYIKKKKSLDVSIGVFTDQLDTSGEWKGENYQGIAINYRPDHLALLPGESGACSWNDGCGIRLNKEKGGKVLMLNFSNVEEVKQYKDLIINKIVSINQGMLDIINQIRSKLDSFDIYQEGNTKIHILEEVYKDYFIYRISTQGKEDEYIKQNFTVNQEQVEFGDVKVNVIKKIEYKVVQQNNDTNVNTENKETKGGKEMSKPCCKEKVEMLIQSNAFQETEREFLEALNEETIDKFITINNELEKKEEEINGMQNNKQETMTKEQAIEILKGQISDQNIFLSMLPKEMAEQMNYGLALHKQHKQNLIGNIKESTDVYSDEELSAMDMKGLEKLAKAVKVNVDYSFAGDTKINVNQNESKEAPMVLGGFAK